QAMPSNDIRYGWQLEDFSEDEFGIEATVRPMQGGGALRVRARYLVGADGARSSVRRWLGIRWLGETGIVRDFMGGKMFAVYLRAPGLRIAIPHRPAWMNVAVNAERRAFIIPVDGVAEYAFHAALRPGEDADAWT